MPAIGSVSISPHACAYQLTLAFLQIPDYISPLARRVTGLAPEQVSGFGEVEYISFVFHSKAAAI